MLYFYLNESQILTELIGNANECMFASTSVSQVHGISSRQRGSLAIFLICHLVAPSSSVEPRPEKQCRYHNVSCINGRKVTSDPCGAIMDVLQSPGCVGKTRMTVRVETAGSAVSTLTV